jgi:hypothetical protein
MRPRTRKRMRKEEGNSGSRKIPALLELGWLESRNSRQRQPRGHTRKKDTPNEDVSGQTGVGRRP